ncbi:hypothetical protein [Actinomadura rifamycini]|uniref:hypothetical protein n=1 Tax=Actinomadura rifamycini TaxID=31962 RepID=UPI00047A23E6|nr:hypothetical protein [Actinomadura rifamycini]
MSEKNQVSGPQRTENPAKRALITAGGGALLLPLAWTMFGSNYLEPAKALEEGAPGSFTLAQCAERRGKTYCGGSFRSDDGRLVREHVSLPNSHDAEGVRVGESFPARLLDGPGADGLARADATGRANVRAKGVSAAGLGVAGVAVLGFAARRALVRRESGVWRPVGVALGLAVSAGVAVYVVWSVMGSGFWA